MKRGVPPTARNERTGLLTPPARTPWARAKSASFRGCGDAWASTRKQSVPQRSHEGLGLRGHAREDRGLDRGVAARLTRAEFHHKVEELAGVVPLEGEDELVVVDPERVARVDRDLRVLVADAEVLAHGLLALFEGERVPLALLRERIDEEEAGAGRHARRAGAILPRVRVPPEVHAALAHREVRVRRLEVRSKLRRDDPARDLLQVLGAVGNRPCHEVAIAAQPHERVEADPVRVAKRGKLGGKPPLLRGTRLPPLQAPALRNAVERVLEVLARGGTGRAFQLRGHFAALSH